MNDQTDSQLLRAYTERHSEPAFAELVRRHVDFVYSAALRMVCESHLAEDVTQSVFVALAKNAAQLTDRAVLSGWLHRTAQNIAAQTVRTDVRRRAREQEAAVMNQLLSAGPDAVWEHIAPHLDAALGELSEPDRDALLLRYFESKSAREIAQTLGISDEAAQKRVSRAVERLRGFFAKRGAVVGAGGIIAAISVHAVQAAPAGLALTISTTAILAGSTIATAAVVTKAIAMTTLQKTLVVSTVAILAGAGIYQARLASHLRDEVETLRLTQAPLLGELEQLRSDNERLSKRVDGSAATGELSDVQLNELLKLRNRVGIHSRELTELKSALAQQAPKMDLVARELNGFLASIADQGRRSLTNAAMGKIGRMSSDLSLSLEQQESVRNVLLSNIEARTQADLARVSGDLSLDEVWNRKGAIEADEDRVLAGLLTPDQMSQYQQFKADDLISESKGWRRFEIAVMKQQLHLNDEQAERLSSALAGLNRGEGGQGITYYSNARDQLEIRLRAFQAVLTPEQLQTYRRQKLEDIEEHEQLPIMIQALKK